MGAYTLRDGQGCELEIEAEDIKQAREKAREWAREGDYPGLTETTWVSVSIITQGEDGEEEQVGTVKVQIDPPEPPCTEATAHDWCYPRTQGNGGGVIVVEKCRNCGRRMETNTWAQDPEDGEEGLTSISYLEPLDPED